MLTICLCVSTYFCHSGPASAERFKEIQRAYEVLKNCSEGTLAWRNNGQDLEMRGYKEGYRFTGDTRGGRYERSHLNIVDSMKKAWHNTDSKYDFPQFFCTQLQAGDNPPPTPLPNSTNQSYRFTPIVLINCP